MRLLSPVLIRAFPRASSTSTPRCSPLSRGSRPSARRWSYGAKVSGATVHLVDEGLDSGPVVAQEAVAVEDGDTPQALAARILDVGASYLSRRGTGDARRPISRRGSSCPLGGAMSLRPEESSRILTKGCVDVVTAESPQGQARPAGP